VSPARTVLPARAGLLPFASRHAGPVRWSLPYAGCEQPARATAHDRSGGHALRPGAPHPSRHPRRFPRPRKPAVTITGKDRGISGSPGDFGTLRLPRSSVKAKPSAQTGRLRPAAARSAPGRTRHGIHPASPHPAATALPAKTAMDPRPAAYPTDPATTTDHHGTHPIMPLTGKCHPSLGDSAGEHGRRLAGPVPCPAGGF